jgi:hypothetical protein
VAGTGGSVTGVTGTFNVTSKVSGASSINYSGFAVGSVAGGGAGATITGSGLTYGLTSGTPNAGSSSGVTWSAFPNISDATGTINIPGTASLTGNVTAQTISYAGHTGAVIFSLSGAAGTSTGISGTRSGVTTVTGSGNSDTITGSGATYNLTAPNAGNSSGVSWTSFENITNTGAGTFNLTTGTGTITGTVASSGSTTLSAPDNASLAVNIPGPLLLSGLSTSWTMTGPGSPPTPITPSSSSTNVYYNGTCIQGPACGAVVVIVGSIGGTIAQISQQALQEAQDTDSVQKQIDYAFTGEVGTTPPMDHRIDETGISTPACFEESREATACRQ